MGLGGYGVMRLWGYGGRVNGLGGYEVKKLLLFKSLI